MKLKFKDGITIDTSGPLRKLELADGWYVTGQGMLIPCKDEMEADEILTISRRNQDDEPSRQTNNKGQG